MECTKGTWYWLPSLSSHKRVRILVDIVLEHQQHDKLVTHRYTSFDSGSFPSLL